MKFIFKLFSTATLFLASFYSFNSCQKPITPMVIKLDTELREQLLQANWIKAAAKLEKKINTNYIDSFLLGYVYQKQKNYAKAIDHFLRSAKKGQQATPERISSAGILAYLQHGENTSLFPYACVRIANLMQHFGLHDGSENVANLIDINQKGYLAQQKTTILAQKAFRNKDYQQALILEKILSESDQLPTFRMATIYSRLQQESDQRQIYRQILYYSPTKWKRNLAANRLLEISPARDLSPEDGLMIGWSLGDSLAIPKVETLLKQVVMQTLDISQRQKYLQTILFLWTRDKNLVKFRHRMSSLFKNHGSDALLQQMVVDYALDLYRRRDFQDASQLLTLLFSLSEHKSVHLDATVIIYALALQGIIANQQRHGAANEAFSKIETLAQKHNLILNQTHFLEMLSWQIILPLLQNGQTKTAKRHLQQHFNLTRGQGSSRFHYWQAAINTANFMSIPEILTQYSHNLFYHTEGLYSELALLALLEAIAKDQAQKAWPKNVAATWQQSPEAKLLDQLSQRLIHSQHHGIFRLVNPNQTNALLPIESLWSDQSRVETVAEIIRQNNILQGLTHISYQSTESIILPLLKKSQQLNDAWSFWQMGLVSQSQDILRAYLGSQEDLYQRFLIYFAQQSQDAALSLKYAQKFLPGQPPRVLDLYDEGLQKALYPRPFMDSVTMAARDFNIDANLIWAIMKSESGFTTKAVSPAGAVGLMQIMPITGHKICRQLGIYPPDLTIPHNSIIVAAKYLRGLLDRYQGNLLLAIAAYNAGPGNVNVWQRNLTNQPFALALESIPFGETQRYVARVFNAYLKYQGIYGSIKQ